MSQPAPDRMSQPVPDRTLEPVTRFAVDCARVLHTNGESTDDTLAAARQLVSAKITPRWRELQIESTDGSLAAVAEAAPTGIDMDRVASALLLADDVVAG